MARGCNKVRHASQKAANIAVAKMFAVRDKKPEKDGPGSFMSYKCGDCGCWHVGRWGKRGQSMAAFIDRVIARDQAKKLTAGDRERMK